MLALQLCYSGKSATKLINIFSEGQSEKTKAANALMELTPPAAKAAHNELQKAGKTDSHAKGINTRGDANALIHTKLRPHREPRHGVLGLSTITGETGAGKSILFQSAQADSRRAGKHYAIRHGHQPALSEAEFDIARMVAQRVLPSKPSVPATHLHRAA